MINFREELEKFKPALEVEELEESIVGNDIKDLTDVLTFLMKRIKANEE